VRPTVIKDRLGELPYMGLAQGELIYDFIHDQHLSQCLELGFYHGVSSAYIGGALQDLKEGHLVTIDLEWAKTLTPNINSVLETCGLNDVVDCYFEKTSYNWRLMKFLKGDPHRSFDFCYFDGGHTWYDTGLAFCLVSRLLKPGGWIIFDDLDWTHEDPDVRDTGRVRAMPEEERQAPQVRLVYELLVKRDPGFDVFFVEGPWGFARKCR
jgi:predicted O-methyltransferase YrrM